MTSHVDHIADADPGAGRLGFERVLLFSDAVFAIAITLLVVDLRLPDLVHADDTRLANALWDARGDILAYVLSVLVIGSFWLAHWRRYHHIQRVDARHAGINLLFLGAIAFLPFPTSVLGNAGDQRVAAVFYAVSVAVASLLALLAIGDAWRRGLFAPAVHRDDVRLWMLAGCVMPIVMLTSLLFLPLVGPTIVELSWVVAALAAGQLSGRRS